MFITPGITDHPHRLDWQKNYEGLAYLVIPVGFMQLLDKNRVSLAQNIAVFLFYFAKHTNTKPRAWKWVAVDHFVGQTQLNADVAQVVVLQVEQSEAGAELA